MLRIQHIRDINSNSPPVPRDLVGSLQYLKTNDYITNPDFMEATVAVSINQERHELQKEVASLLGKYTMKCVIRWKKIIDSNFLERIGNDKLVNQLYVDYEAEMCMYFLCDAKIMLSENLKGGRNGLANGTIARLHSITIISIFIS